MLYVHETADPAKALAVAEASLDRLGVCNRLNLCLVDREARAVLPALISLFRRLGLEVRGTSRSGDARQRACRSTRRSGTSGQATRVESPPCPSTSSTRSTTRWRIANEHTSGLAAAIIAEDGATAAQFLESYRGTAAFWNASTRFTDGYALTGAPETGINVDRTPGPAGPSRTATSGCGSTRSSGTGRQRR